MDACLLLSILGDKFKTFDNCGLQIIVVCALMPKTCTYMEVLVTTGNGMVTCTARSAYLHHHLIALIFDRVVRGPFALPLT